MYDKIFPVFVVILKIILTGSGQSISLLVIERVLIVLIINELLIFTAVVEF